MIPAVLKTCTKCGVEKEDEEGFCKNKRRPSGFTDQCKECDKKYRRENEPWLYHKQKIRYEARKAAAPPKEPKPVIPRKRAWNCEHTDRPNSCKGLCTQCYDSCRYWKDPEKIRAERRGDRARNPEKYANQIRAWKKSWPEERRNEYLAYMRVWRKENYTIKANRDKICELAKEWYRKNVVRKKNSDIQRRTDKREHLRFRDIEAKYNISKDKLLTMFKDQDNKCICGADFGEMFPKKKRREWVVDHDHDCCPKDISCGKCVRMLLCSRCNLVLGLLNEDPKFLPPYMVKYVNKFKHVKEIECPLLNSVMKNLLPSAKRFLEALPTHNSLFVSPSAVAED